jgi:hypothetical protein
MNYIDDEMLLDILDNECPLVVKSLIMGWFIPTILFATGALYVMKKPLSGTILLLLGLCISIMLTILIKKRFKNFCNLNDIDKKINIIDAIDSKLLDQLYKENAITFKAIPSIKVFSFIYNLLAAKNEKLDICILFGKDLNKKFGCKEIVSDL